MDAAVRNLADAGDQPALDGQRIGNGVGGGGVGGAPAGRGSGPGRRARLAASAASVCAGADPAGQRRASSPKTRARSDSRRARPASCCERARCSLSNADKAARRSPSAVRLAREAGPGRLGLAAQLGAARDLGAERGGAAADLGHGRGEQRADMDGVADRAGLDQRQRGGAAGHGLQRGGEPDDRPLPLGEARALRGLERGDQRDAALGGGEIGLGRLDPRGERLRRGAGAVGLAGGAARLALELLGNARRLPRLPRAPGPAPPRRRASCALGRGEGAGAERRRSGRRGGRTAHCPILPDDRGGSQAGLSRGTIARRASRGRADAARSPCRRRAAGPRPPARRRRSRPLRRSGSAPRACRSSRQRSSFRAKATEPSCSPFSSSRMVTLLSAGGGALPPLSGSSVTFVGQVMRFR